jgi:hypothetical protein
MLSRGKVLPEPIPGDLAVGELGTQTDEGIFGVRGRQFEPSRNQYGEKAQI